MKKTILLFLLCVSATTLSCAHRSSSFYHPYTGKGDRDYRTEGVASWYGRPFHGRRTASGERYDMNALTAAHRTLPFGAYLSVTNLSNDQTVIVMINDRGPFVKNRLVDLSRAAARDLGFESIGTARVRVEWIEDPKDHPYLTQVPDEPTPGDPAPDEPVNEAAPQGDIIAQTISDELAQTDRPQ